MARRAIAYRELADSLRRALRNGDYAEGSPLPTEFVLAREHDVSRQTVRRAMQELVSDGLVYRVAGRGTFAVHEDHPYVRSIGSISDLMGLSSDTEMRVTAPLRSVIAATEAAQLGVGTPTVFAVAFSRSHSGTLFSYTSVFLPPPVAALLRDVRMLHRRGARSTATVIGLLDERLSRPMVRAEQTITAVRADAAIAAELGVSSSAALLKVDRLYRDDQGAAVELAVSHFLPEHYQYRVTLRRDPR